MTRTDMNKPPIVVMLVDTEDKTFPELTKEVSDRVDKLINEKVEAYRKELSTEDFKVLTRKMAIERNRMIEQFIFQLVNIRDINKEVMAAVSG